MTAAYGKWLWGVGTYSASLDLVGNLAPGVGLFATTANPVVLAGTMPVAVTLGDAAASSLVSLTGALAPQIAINGLLAGTVIMSGDLPVGVSMAAQMGSGPLWEPDEPCDQVAWDKSELCNG